MRKPFHLILAVLITSLTLIGCSGSSVSSSTGSSYSSEPHSSSSTSSSSSSSGSSSGSQSESPTISAERAEEIEAERIRKIEEESDARTQELLEQFERENRMKRDAARSGYSSDPSSSETYSSPGTYSSPPNTYSSPSYGQSTMGGYGAGVEARIGQQRSADNLQKAEEARRLNAIRNGP